MLFYCNGIWPKPKLASLSVNLDVFKIISSKMSHLDCHCELLLCSVNVACALCFVQYFGKKFLACCDCNTLPGNKRVDSFITCLAVTSRFY